MPLLFPLPFCLHSWWFADLMQSDVVVDVVAVILRLCLGVSCGEHCVCLDQSFVSANAAIVAVLVFCGLQRLNFNFAIHGISQYFFFWPLCCWFVCFLLHALLGLQFSCRCFVSAVLSSVFVFDFSSTSRLACSSVVFSLDSIVSFDTATSQILV